MVDDYIRGEHRTPDDPNPKIIEECLRWSSHGNMETSVEDAIAKIEKIVRDNSSKFTKFFFRDGSLYGKRRETEEEVAARLEDYRKRRVSQEYWERSMFEKLRKKYGEECQP